MFVGPENYFTLRIDDFDGSTVKAWHIEDVKGNKSVNLAATAMGKHIDLVVGKNCRSTIHFINRYKLPLLDMPQ